MAEDDKLENDIPNQIKLTVYEDRVVEHDIYKPRDPHNSFLSTIFEDVERRNCDWLGGGYKSHIQGHVRDTVRSCVQHLKRTLVPLVCEKDILDFSVVPIGSIAEGTKIGKSDEFDFLLVLRQENEYQCLFELECDRLKVTSQNDNVRSYCKVVSRKNHKGEFILNGPSTDPITGHCLL